MSVYDKQELWLWNTDAFWLVAIRMEEVIHECDLRPKWVLGEVDDDVVALTGDHVEAAHRDWSFEKSSIGCDDLE